MSVSAPLAAIRVQHPLLHCISNIVSANDCANLALAIGASPIMAQAPQEMADIAALASAVVLNTGTPDEAKFTAARTAGATANRRSIPVVLDPVGVGASPWRLANIQSLLQQVQPAIVRVNAGEAAALLGLGGSEHGVDSLTAPKAPAGLAAALAQKLGCVVLLSGTEDLIADGQQLCTVRGGSDRMRTVTGAGCMLSVLCGAFAAVQPGDAFTAAVQAARFWKACAEQAEDHAAGAGSFRVALFDAAGNVAGEYFKQHLPQAERKGKRLDDAYTRAYHAPYTLDLDGVRYAFLTCYDNYYNEYIQHIALKKPDVLIVSSLQRGERMDILEMQMKNAAFTCNAWAVRASVSMGGEDCGHGANTMIVAPDGRVLASLGQKTGMLARDVDTKFKHMRADSYGQPPVPNDFFISKGRTPWAYRACGAGIIPGDRDLPYPRICAHRGFNYVAPENSLPAFGAAVALGAVRREDLLALPKGEKIADKLHLR